MPIVEDAIEEVVDGEIRLMPPNKTTHAKIVQALTAAFVRQLDESRIQIYGATFGLVIRKEPLTCRVPDLALFIKANVVEEDGYVHSPPELIIEVLSPSNTPARVREKLLEYEALRVPEVWVFLPEIRAVEPRRSRTWPRRRGPEWAQARKRRDRDQARCSRARGAPSTPPRARAPAPAACDRRS